VLGLSQVTNVLDDIIRYLPNVGSAVIILFLGALFAEFIGNIIRATAAGLGTHTSMSLATLSRYVIYIFAGLAALTQLGIAPQIINILLTGFVAASAIAFGLAFGLGGKEAASDLIAKIRSDFSKS
jgi:small-conductance mechanosensitive channel